MAEEKKRKTYENIRRLAQQCANMENAPCTVYKEGESTYNFCRDDEYSSSLGRYVCNVSPVR